MKVIGISGPSGSGKTTLSNWLLEKLPNCRLTQQDWYFIDPEKCEPEANFCDIRYLYLEEFIEHITSVVQGKAIAAPTIDFSTFRRTDKKNYIEPGDFLIVEGMTIFRISEILNICKFRYYLATRFGCIRARKWERDYIERNKSVEVIKSQLKWVEREYLYDLKTLPVDVKILNNQDTNEYLGLGLIDEILGK